MRRLAIRVVLLVLVLALCGVAFVARRTTVDLPAEALGAVAAPSTGPAGEAPLRLEKGRLVVTVSVDGEGPLDFILDTAAGSSAIAERHVESLGIGSERLERVRVVGVGAARIMTQARLTSLEVGRARVTGIRAVVIDDQLLGGRNGYDGLLGNDVLRRYDAELDVPGGRLRLYGHGDRQASERGPRLVPLPMLPGQDGFVTVEATVSGQPVRAILDTGAPVTLLNWHGAALAGINRSSPGLRRLSTGARGLDGLAFETHTHPLDALAIGPTSFDETEVRIANLPVFAIAGLADGPAALIGADLLQDCPILLSYSDRRVHICTR